MLQGLKSSDNKNEKKHMLEVNELRGIKTPGLAVQPQESDLTSL